MREKQIVQFGFSFSRLRFGPESVLGLSDATGSIIPERNQDYITVFDPNPPLHLASYVADSLGSVRPLHHPTVRRVQTSSSHD